MMNAALKTLDAQINDYLLTASGHLKESNTFVDVRKVAAYGAAASSALVMMSQAEAAIVLNGGDTPPLSVFNGAGSFSTSTGRGIYAFNQFDMDGDGNNDFAIWGYTSNASATASDAGNVGMAIAYGTWQNSNSIVGGYTGNDVYKLSPGDLIGASNSWTGGYVMDTNMDVALGLGNGASNWFGGAPEEGLVGVKFVNNSGTHYGWICLKSVPTTPSEITVQSYAYEDQPDTPIQAGDNGSGLISCFTNPPAPVQVPVMDPVAYGLSALALGGLGLAGLRRRRLEQRGGPGSIQ